MTLRPGSTTKSRLASIAVPLLVFVVAIRASKPYAVGVFHDDGVYAILAKSLATGQGYRYLHLPGRPAATHYPPGYPFMLSLLWRIAPSFPGNVRLLLLANALLLAITAAAIVRLTRTTLGWPRPASSAAAIVGTLSYPLVMLSSLVLSETLFAALLVSSLIVAERVVCEEQAGDRGAEVRRLVLVGLFGGIIALVRTHGAAFLLAVLIVLACRRRWRAVVTVIVPAIVVIAPWQIWSAMQPALGEPLRGSYGSYGGWLAEGLRAGGATLFLHTIAANMREVGALLADRFAIIDSAIVRNSAALLGVGAIFVGAWKAVRLAPVTVVFAIVYVCVLLAWPYTPWRFVFAIWPLVIIAIGEAARPAFARRTNRTFAQWAAMGCVTILAVGTLREEARAYAHRTWRQPGDAATAQIAPLMRWVSRETTPSDVLAVEGEQLVYLFTGRQAVPVAPFTAAEYMRTPTVQENASMMQNLVGRFPVTYIATVSPPFVAAADSLIAHSASSKVALARVGPLSSGGAGVAYRVVRRTR